MQFLPSEILAETKKEKMKKLDETLRTFVLGSRVGELVECPSCHYVSRNKRFSCKVFRDAIKCFACGLWRKI